MPNYSFDTLSPIDFEIFIRDLMQKYLQVRLESFKIGKDQGIDLRYCQSEVNDIIIQCKHYLESGFKGLYQNLKKEIEKVRILSPKRYILATSVPLSVSQKKKILSLFTPFIKSSQDILGKGDINNLLGLYPEIEKQNFKLWIQSVHIIEEIFYRKVKNISKEEFYKIQNRTKYYVQNESFSEALKILDKYNFCIIAGIPGIGKTTLAEMLLLHYINQGYEIVKITDDISEASIFDYMNEKRVFYYDDFLGQTSLAEKLNKNEDQKIIDFIAAIKRSQVSKLILTTREYILNQAQLIYEKIARTNFDGETCVVDLSKYSRKDKARILYNHIFFSELPYQFKESLLDRKSYLKIIDHKNYNPRIIDLMTSFKRVEHIASTLYFKNFLQNLDNPLEIWRHAFEEQILPASRNLLVVIVSLPNEVFLEDLESAFQNFHFNHSKKYSYSTNPNDFRRALKELEGNFIKTEKSGERIIVSFNNPSISDFMVNYLQNDRSQLRILIESSIFFDQLMKIWEHYDLNKIEKDSYLERVEVVINNRSCRLILVTYPDKKSLKSTWDMPFEEKFRFFVKILHRLNSGKCQEVYGSLFGKLEKRICNGEVNLEQLVYLLFDLKKKRLVGLKRNNNLFNKIKSILFFEPDSYEGMKPICKFIEYFPVAINSKERKLASGYLTNLMESYDPYGYSDPDFARSDADDLKYMAEILEVEADYFIQEIEEHATNLEEEIMSSFDDYSSYDNDYGTKEYCDNREIESIFNTLIS